MTARPGRALRGGRARRSPRPGSTCRGATSPRAPALLAGGVLRLRRRPARARALRPRPRRARPAAGVRRDRGRGAPAGHVAHRPAGPGRRPARRLRASATARPSGRPGRAGSRRCPSATATAGRGRSRTGRRASSAAGACRWSGNVAMDAVMADVTDVPGPPVDTTDEFVLHRARPGTSGSRSRELAQERTTNSWEVVTAMSRRLPRVYHAAAGPVGLRTLTERRG